MLPVTVDVKKILPSYVIFKQKQYCRESNFNKGIRTVVQKMAGWIQRLWLTGSRKYGKRRSVPTNSSCS